MPASIPIRHRGTLASRAAIRPRAIFSRKTIAPLTPRTVAIELAAPANASYRSVDVYIFLIESLRRYGWRNISSAWLAVTYRRRPGSGCGFSRGQYRRCNRGHNCGKAKQLGSSHRAAPQGRCAQALPIRRLSLASRYSWSAEYFRVYFRGLPALQRLLWGHARSISAELARQSLPLLARNCRSAMSTVVNGGKQRTPISVAIDPTRTLGRRDRADRLGTA